MEVTSPLPLEKPQNGFAGLRHWRHDVFAGLMVSLVSLPFSLGIAIASGAPPVSGLISAIIAGLIYPFLGGSYVTISGPAAGLAPALLAGMTALGAGDREVGYPLLLGVICMTGCVQIVLSWLRAARFSALFPTVVVEGMLASIGLLIIAKELPHFLGVKYHAHEFFEYVLETPSAALHAQPKVVLLGAVCLGLIFWLANTRVRWLKVVPAPLTVVLLGIVLGRALQLEGDYLIRVPENVFEHGLVLPNFRELASNSRLWSIVATIIVTLTLIDGVESLATVAAIDKIDPFRRKSDPNRTLLAMGVSNICSSLAGGLTIIPGGVKSTTCIVSGGRTLWANFYNALFLVVFLFFAHGLINLIPYSTIAAVVIYIGYKLCAPKVWRHVAHIGREQLLVFSATVVMTLLTDLLWGIVFGMAVKLLVSVYLASRQTDPAAPRRASAAAAELCRQCVEMFRNPVAAQHEAGGAHHLYFERSIVCFNSLHVFRELAAVPPEVSRLYLYVGEGVRVIDHTSRSNLRHFLTEFTQDGRRHAELVGLDRLQPRSHHELCMRVRAGRALAAAEQAAPDFSLSSRLLCKSLFLMEDGPSGTNGVHRNGNGDHPAVNGVPDAAPDELPRDELAELDALSMTHRNDVPRPRGEDLADLSLSQRTDADEKTRGRLA